MKVTSDYRLGDNDKIVHTLYRTETPVLDTPIDILYEDEDLVAVDKPSSIPVHEGGNYKLNSLLGILKHDPMYNGKYNTLKCVHRLDK
jgi:tRNA pseudouridine32 synthase / 2,5-diamino-6-(5-phospho-D-ribitylamino)-pyrimidin-4(3H)-one deaminase